MLAGAAMLAIAFLSHSIVLLIFEPAMGFREFSDFFELEKIVPALGSTAWNVGNVMHVLVGIGLLFLSSGISSSSTPRPTLMAASGFAAAPLFVVVGMSGIVGEQLLGLLGNGADRDAALLGLLIGTRTTVLYAAAVLFGGMVIAISAQSGFAPRWLRLLGLPVGIAAMVFAVFPTPLPLFLFIWSTAVVYWVWRRA